MQQVCLDYCESSEGFCSDTEEPSGLVEDFVVSKIRALDEGLETDISRHDAVYSAFENEKD